MSTQTPGTTCSACQRLARLGVQCNTCRATAPNRRTLVQRAIVQHMNDTGCTVVEAEAHFGTTAGVTVNA